MTDWGYTLSSEEHDPRQLVRFAQRAEDAGFDFVSISDHFHPWIDAQGHSPFVWSVLGAVAQTTSRLRVGTGVTCPILRVHPAIVAQAAATASLLLEGRFFLGVGTGEALNEHILGDRWPTIEERQDMLREAVALIRSLWEGAVVDHHGRSYTVENARIYDIPERPVPIVVSAFGTSAAELAAEIGDGLWMTGPNPDVLAAFEKAGGSGPRIGQLTLCWAPDKDQALATVRRIWPNTALPGQLAQDLPTPSHFEQASALVTPDLLAEQVTAGPDPGPVLDAMRGYVEAGIDHVHLHQVGPDQEGFFRFWERELRPNL